MKSYSVTDYEHLLDDELQSIQSIQAFIHNRISMLNGVNASHYSIEHQKLYAWLSDILKNQYHTAFLHDIKEEEQRIFHKIQQLHQDEYFFDMEEKRVHAWLNEHSIIIERYHELQAQYVRQKQLIQELQHSPPQKYIREREDIIKEAKKWERFEKFAHYQPEYLLNIHRMNFLQRWWHYRKASPSERAVFDLPSSERSVLINLLKDKVFESLRQRFAHVEEIIDQYNRTCKQFQQDHDALANVIHDFQLTHEEFLLEHQGYVEQLKAIQHKKSNIRQGILRLKDDSSNSPERIVQKIFDALQKRDIPKHYPELDIRYRTYKAKLEQETELYLSTIESVKHVWMAHQEAWVHYSQSVMAHRQQIVNDYISHSIVSRAEQNLSSSWTPIGHSSYDSYMTFHHKEIHEKPCMPILPTLHYTKEYVRGWTAPEDVQPS